MRGDYNLESGSCAGSITGACHVTIGISGACARAGAVWPVRCGCDLRLPAGLISQSQSRCLLDHA